MIKTGLPYDFDIMNQIDEEGALVDMSNIDYPGIDAKDIVRTTFIYLRNTGYSNVKLDFSSVDYKLKEEFICFYLLGDIEYNINDISSTIMKLLAKYKNINLEMDTILTSEEEDMFIENNKNILEELNTFAYSLPLYSISRLDVEDFEFTYDDITHTDFVFNSNVCSVIENPAWNILYELEPTQEPKFYTKMFNMDNNKLFETIMKCTPFSVLLYGMANPEEWKLFSNLIKEYMGR